MSETCAAPDDDRPASGDGPASDEHATLRGMAATTLVLLSAGALALAAAPTPAAAAAALSATFLLASLGLAAARPLNERAATLLAADRWQAWTAPEDGPTA